MSRTDYGSIYEVQRVNLPSRYFTVKHKAIAYAASTVPNEVWRHTDGASLNAGAKPVKL